MGNDIKSCLPCFQEKEDSDGNNFPNPSKIEPIINIPSNVFQPEPQPEPQSPQQFEPQPELQPKPTDDTMQLFKNQFNSDPNKKYKIKEKFHQNLYLVNLRDNPKITRLMKTIPNEKIISDKIKNKDFLKKAENLQLLEHSNILILYEVYIYGNNYYLICEENKEQNLFKRIESGTLDESITKKIMEQIFNSITYLHEKNIYNIGLKLDDLFLLELKLKGGKKVIKKKSGKNVAQDNGDKKENESKKTYSLKLSAINYLEEEYENSKNCFYYYPPEIIRQIEEKNLVKINENKDNNTYDEWVCGIIMYYLLSGEFPFKGETQKDISSSIKNNDIDFSSKKFDNISESCKNLISKLLEKDQNKRIKAKDCCQELFFTGKSEEKIKKVEKLDEDSLEILQSLLKVTKPISKFHEVITAYLCLNFIDKDEKNLLSDLFKYIDEDNNNVLSKEDLKKAFDKNDITYDEEDIKHILDVFDYDQNKLIQLQEFLRVLCNKKALFTHEHIQNVFNTIDSDKNDIITAEDIKEFIGSNENDKKKVEKEFMEPFGMKPDDKLMYHQFYKMLTKNILFTSLKMKKTH